MWKEKRETCYFLTDLLTESCSLKSVCVTRPHRATQHVLRRHVKQVSKMPRSFLVRSSKKTNTAMTSPRVEKPKEKPGSGDVRDAIRSDTHSRHTPELSRDLTSFSEPHKVKFDCFKSRSWTSPKWMEFGPEKGEARTLYM